MACRGEQNARGHWYTQCPDSEEGKRHGWGGKGLGEEWDGLRSAVSPSSTA